MQRKCACGGTPGPTGECAECRRKRLLGQPKLTINQPGDRYEQEADRIADEVMRMPEPRLHRQAESEEEEELLQTKSLAGQITPLLQRQVEEEEEEEEVLQTKPLMQRQARADGVSTAPPIVHDVLHSPGQPLDAATRSFMEPRFGHDFSQVRVHKDAKAAESAQSVNALAYTVGHNITFGEGQYAPETSKGQKLIAHELTHVIQQSGARNLETELVTGSATDRSEQEANQVADAVISGGTSVTEPIASSVNARPGSVRLQRLGGNPDCTDAEAGGVHQAIFDARGWLNKAIPKLGATPLSAPVLRSLRRNFGSTYGVASNATLIRDRLRVARGALGRIPFSCDTPGTTALCAANHCGWAIPGSNEATICTNPTSTLDLAWPFAARCVLHESLHAAMSFMTEDVYTSDPAYPGAGTQPLKNPASYTKLTMDLS